MQASRRRYLGRRDGGIRKVGEYSELALLALVGAGKTDVIGKESRIDFVGRAE